MALSLQSRSGMWPAIFCATAAVGLVVGYVEGLLSGMTIVGLGIAWVAGSAIRDVCRSLFGPF